MLHPTGAVIGLALGKALAAVDGQQADPKVSALVCAAMASAKRLKEKQDARLLLLLGASSLHLSVLQPSNEYWKERALKAFRKCLIDSDNAFVAADAALGLMQIAEIEGRKNAATQFRQLAKDLGSKSSLLGFRPGSGPSIWDVMSKPIDFQERLFNTVAHVSNRQISRTQKLLERVR